MNANDIIVAYLKILLACFEYDVDVFSKGWLYYWLLIPASVYLMFFVVKWLVLTLPVTMPLLAVAHLMGSIFGRSSSSKRK